MRTSPFHQTPKTFFFSPWLQHIRTRGMQLHPAFPDSSFLDANGAAIYTPEIDHCIPSRDDIPGILRFLGLDEPCAERIWIAYLTKHTTCHQNHTEPIPDPQQQQQYIFPLAKILLRLYYRHGLPSKLEGVDYESSSDGYIIAAIEHCGLSPAHAIWCGGLVPNDPQYSNYRDQGILETWFRRPPEWYAFDLVTRNYEKLVELWRQRLEYPWMVGKEEEGFAIISDDDDLVEAVADEEAKRKEEWERKKEQEEWDEMLTAEPPSSVSSSSSTTFFSLFGGVLAGLKRWRV